MLSTQQKIKGTPQVCNGAVVKEIGKSLVKICTDGKIKLKPRKQVPVVFLLHTYPAKWSFLLFGSPRGGGSFKYFTTNIDIWAIFLTQKTWKFAPDYFKPKDFKWNKKNHTFRFHLLTQVGEGYALLGRDTGPGKDCLWYGTTFCDGDLVEDLYRWWFKMKCSKSRFTVVSVPYTQVVQDPRFKP